MAYPYPIRDWTRADDYPKPGDLNPNRWAWEFLRRNPEYQLLDAFAAGAEPAEIVAAVFPNEPDPAPDYPATKKTRKSLERTQDLRDGGYFCFLI